MFARILSAGLLASTLVSPSIAIDVNWDSDASIKEAAGTAAFDMVSWYTGNETGDVPGNVPDPYSWYICGAMFNTLLDYWRWTGDSSYNAITYQGMLHQVGKNKDFQPDNQTLSTANDDQGFWAMMSMTAAEYGFQDPPDDQPQWLALTQAVFNEYVNRWDTSTCGGGLKWQINQMAAGAHYKNSISNGCFFNVAARLWRYTGKDVYKKWAEKVWNWMEDVKYLQMQDGGLAVYDGANDGTTGGKECKPPAGPFYSYNSGIFLHGAAVMADKSGDAKWKQHCSDLMDYAEKHYFRNGVMFEQQCENQHVSRCDDDMTSFKGTFVRFMAYSALLLPDMYDRLMALIASSAKKAAPQCTGTDPDGRGHAGTICSSSWLHNGWDGISGLNEEMNAVEVFASNLITKKSKGAITQDMGGTSGGNADAGKDVNPDNDPLADLPPITTADKAGAGILTALALGGLMGGVYFLIIH